MLSLRLYNGIAQVHGKISLQACAYSQLKLVLTGPRLELIFYASIRRRACRIKTGDFMVVFVVCIFHTSTQR